MSRPIRFRAWDKKKRKMFPVDIESMDAGIMPVKSNWEDTIHPFDADVCELMQYTGLRDRHGKEIFEGDVVSSFGCLGKVIWIEDRAKFGVKGKVPTKKGFNNWITLNCWNKGEVVGNVWENPILLEGGKK